MSLDYDVSHEIAPCIICCLSLYNLLCQETILVGSGKSSSAPCGLWEFWRGGAFAVKIRYHRNQVSPYPTALEGNDALK